MKLADEDEAVRRSGQQHERGTMRYRWDRTGDTWYAGTDTNVFISLAGDKAR